MRALTHDDYTVALICAVPIELAAAMIMLDEEDSHLAAHPSDSNTYTLGRIGEHNVVIACLPTGHIGASSAATLATHMKERFNMIRFGLIVGVGGGAPSAKNDIRLGDVIVGKPGTKGTGVVQYDFGRTEHNKFVRTGSLNAPPDVLLTALSKLRANHVRYRNRIAHYLSQIPPNLQPTFAHPGAQQDRLFEAVYVHPGGDTCEKCDVNRLIKRDCRDSKGPVVYYGIIASANQIMKDGVTRDKLAKETGALCFEMEAAGLVNTFPCVVIRGICDYSDSHINKQWQPYAAAAAMAYAKDFLSVIPPKQGTDATTVPAPVPTPTPGLTQSPSTSTVVPPREQAHAGTDRPDIPQSHSAQALPASASETPHTSHANFATLTFGQTRIAQNGDLQLNYANAMRHHPFGFALYHPCDKMLLKPGSCGYFNYLGDWNPIADVLSSNGRFVGLDEDPQKAEPQTLNWGPKCSEHVTEYRFKTAAERFEPV